MTTLQPGDSVAIYHDPLTEIKLEGLAILRHQVGFSLDGYERWTVTFCDEPGFAVVRTLRLHNRLQAERLCDHGGF